MAAFILANIEKMEQQQASILKKATQENKTVLNTLSSGMTENQEIMISNIKVLKDKMKANAEWLCFTLIITLIINFEF